MHRKATTFHSVKLTNMFFLHFVIIGTGKVATPEIAQAVHAQCRKIIAGMFDDETAENVRILYGGSVTPESVDELMAQQDIDGALVGGASLDAEKFGRIINFQA